MKSSTVADDTFVAMVLDVSGPAVESDPYVIIDGLREEMDRVIQAEDSSCICIVSPDGAVEDSMMDVLGKWFAASLRPIDDLYRIADNKYLLMLREVDRDSAVYCIKRMRERLVSGSLPAAGDDRQGQVTASFGGTILDSMAPLHEHMDRASEAHDRALKGSGDTICIWTPQF